MEDFEKLLQTETKMVLVDFYAQWCGPCKKLTPFLEKLDDTKIHLVKIDVDENSDIADKYKITSLPTILFFKNGILCETFIGANENKLSEIISKLI